MSKSSNGSLYHQTRPPMAPRNSSSDSIKLSGQNSILAPSISELRPITSRGAESVYNVDIMYKNNNRFATQSVLPPSDYHSPYYIPFRNTDEPRPVDQLIYRFSIWKMIIKQIVFYFKEMCVFKSQTYQGNRAMLENLEILRRQNSGKLKVKANANKNLKKSLSSNNLETMNHGDDNGRDGDHLTNQNSRSMDNIFESEIQQNIVNRLLQTTFLPPGDNSVLSISSTFFNNHNYLKEKELLTYQHLSNRLIPRLENLKDQLNDTIKQMNSIKNSSDFKTKNLKMEIAKTGAILSDYVTSIELLKTGRSKSSLGTTIQLKESEIDPKKDPYILKLKLDLQLKDQLYIEAHLKEIYYDLQFKAVQLEKILYSEIQSCISTYTDLIDSELNAVKDNMILPFKQGFTQNDPTIDWDYFIKNDNKKNFLPVNAKNTLQKVKKVRKNSDIVYPYRNNVVSSCIFSGYLERKSKYLKNYTKFYYVLTINFLHEFRTNDRMKDLHPLQSFSLNDVTVATVDSDPKKFVVRVYKSGDKESSKAKFTFKCEDIDTTIKWVDYLSDLTEFDDTIERNTSYDDDEEDNDEGVQIPMSTEQNNFADITSIVSGVSTRSGGTISPASTIFPGTGTMASPPIVNDYTSPLSHSRSTSDEMYKFQQSVHSPPYPPAQQTQQQPQSYQYAPPSDDYFSQPNISSMATNIPFKSVKSPTARQFSSSSTSSLPLTGSRTSSRSSSRTSSRASSPSRIRAVSNGTRTNMNPGIKSPKLTPSSLTPTGASSSTPSLSGDYFSYAPRKVQASIIRNGNRLASSTVKASSSSLSTSGRLTPNNNSNSGLGLNTALNVPKINIHDSSPVVTNKPNIEFHFDNSDSVQSYSSLPQQQEGGRQEDQYDQGEQVPHHSSDTGLARRRKTLSEKLDISGLVGGNKTNSDSGIIRLPRQGDQNSMNAGFMLPQTPGIIPGSRMNSVFIGDMINEDKELENEQLPELTNNQH